MTTRSTREKTQISDRPDFRSSAQELLPELVALRRELHQHPEIGLDLPISQARVLTALADLGLDITRGVATTSVVAVLRGALPGPTVLLRGDMDALPVAEDNDLDYRSLNGAMHACGHDLHTAGLVGAAKILAAQRENLAGSVIFMFQPGEEGYGGAKIMVDEGVLEAAGTRPVAAFALHVGTGPYGVFSTKPGAVLASASEIHIRLRGEGGHGSNPSSTRDPIPALAELVLALQTMVTRRTDVHDPVVLSVTKVQAGTALNVIPDVAYLGATLRTFSTSVLDSLEVDIDRLARGIAAAHQLDAEFELVRSYPVTVNNDSIAARAAQVVVEEFGDERFTPMALPFMGSEDFSFVLQEVPGAYVVVGARPDSIPADSGIYPHSPKVLFDDAIVADQAALLAALAWDALSQSATG